MGFDGLLKAARGPHSPLIHSRLPIAIASPYLGRGGGRRGGGRREEEEEEEGEEEEGEEEEGEEGRRGGEANLGCAAATACPLPGRPIPQHSQ